MEKIAGKFSQFNSTRNIDEFQAKMQKLAAEIYLLNLTGNLDPF